VVLFFMAVAMGVVAAATFFWPHVPKQAIGCFSFRDSSSSSDPGVFYTYFYNHAHRPRLEKLLHLGPIYFSEKPAPPSPLRHVNTNTGRGYLPAFGFRMPEQKGWAGLEPETPKLLSDLKQKKEEDSEWPELAQASWLAAPKCFSQRIFGRKLFLGRDSTAQLSCPYFYLGRGSWPSNGNSCPD
jgi:hypothetical protein